VTSIAPRKRFLGNFGAHFGGLYGSKILDFALLTVVSRKLPIEQVGTYFLADAAGGMIFRLLDLGLYPVLQRRAARNEAGVAILSWATRVRFVGVVVLSLVFAAVARWQYPDRWMLVSAFFFSSGLYVVHEIPRALLAGRERFATTARIGVATKVFEVGCSIPAIWFGLGVIPWVIGRVVTGFAQLFFFYRAIHRDLEGFPSPERKAVLREGLPFWFAALFESAVFRIDTVVVGAYLGLTATAHLGIASRVIGGGLSVVSSMLLVATPTLAREHRRFITETEAAVVLCLSVGLGVAMYLTAPFIVFAITGKWQSGSIAVVRTLAPVIALTTIGRSLEAWLLAKNRERAIAVLTVVTGVLSAIALWVLVPMAGTTGAAAARDLRALFEAVGAGLYAYVVIAGIRAPLAWLIAKVPFTGPVRQRAVESHARALARRFADIPGVVRVDLSGSAVPGGRRAFRYGTSDLDFTVATRLTGLELSRAVRECEALGSKRSPFGRSNLVVLDADVLSWARRLGHPVLNAPHVALAGDGADPRIDPDGAREWGLTQALSKLILLERVALEESRHDGGARTGPLIKQFHYLLEHLGERERHLAELAREGFVIPPELDRTVTHRRLWMPPEEVANLLRAADRLLRGALEAATTEWRPEEPIDAPSRPWSGAIESIARRHAGELARLRCRSVEITATEPSGTDAMLLAAADPWSDSEWLGWLRAAARLGPLSLPFRGSAWPVVVPVEAVAADATLEHGVLLRAARRASRIVLHGEPPRALAPPAAFVRRAATRETLVALIRLPVDIARVRRAERTPWLVTGPLARVEDHWRFRSRSYAEGRLAALSLLIDDGETPGDPDSVRVAYRAHHDDALARLEPHATGDALALALDGWMENRISELDLRDGAFSSERSAANRGVAV